MKLEDLITPKNKEDGSLDHRFVAISQKLCNLIGESHASKLLDLYEKSTRLQGDASSSGLKLVIALYQIDMNERFERSRMKAHIRDQLQELGFKPANVSKLMGAGEFYANNYGKPITHDQGEYMDVEYFGAESIERQNRFLNKYAEKITSLYELSRMDDVDVHKVRRDYLTYSVIYSSSEMEDLRRKYPRNENERRGRKPSRAGFQETRPTYALATHESLAVMDDADEWEGESTVEQPKSGQLLITEFFRLFKTGEFSRRLDEFTPSAQAQLIEEIKAGIPLLEDFVAKNSTIDVVSTHWSINPEPRSNHIQPIVRFWSRGQIAVTAKTRIDQTLNTNPEDAQAMIAEWIIY